MEEISPTMPSIMFLRFLHFKKSSHSCQGEIQHAFYQDNPEDIQCPHCKSKNYYLHGFCYRNALLANHENTLRNVRIKVQRYRCKDCHKTYVMGCEKIGLLKYQHRNEQCNRLMLEDCVDGQTNKCIAKRYGVCESTVEHELHRTTQKLIEQQINYPLPRVLGIDEHKIHKGGKYAITLVDLAHHRVYDVIETKDKEALERYLREKKGRMEVRVVCMDFCPMFRSVVKRLLPNAKIVADRFHVIKLVNKALHDYIKAVAPDQRWKRGYTRLLGKRSENLTDKQKERLNELLGMDSSFKLAYDFKQRLCSLLNLKSLTKQACQEPLRQLIQMVDELRHTAHPIWRRLADTLSEWFVPIICMWRFTRNNGITEGFHRKMKLIQRRAYGFRNFANYRLRVLLECGHLFHKKRTFHKKMG